MRLNLCIGFIASYEIKKHKIEVAKREELHKIEIIKSLYQSTNQKKNMERIFTKKNLNKKRKNKPR